MKKTLMLVASVAMAVVLTGCGGSKSSGDADKGASSGGTVSSARSAAEEFVGAILKGDFNAAAAFYDTLVFDDGAPRQRTEAEKANIESNLKEFIDGAKSQEGNVSGTAISEVIRGGRGYYIVDGKKCTDMATVIVQLVRNGEKQPATIKVELVNVDGAWKISSYKPEDMGKGSRSTRSKYN